MPLTACSRSASCPATPANACALRTIGIHASRSIRLFTASGLLLRMASPHRPHCGADYDGSQTLSIHWSTSPGRSASLWG